MQRRRVPVLRAVLARSAVVLWAAVLWVAGCVEILGDVEILDNRQQSSSVTADAGAEAPPVCSAGVSRCDRAARLQCKPGGDGWRILEVCASQALCAPEACRAPACLPNEARCFASDPASSSRQLQICNEGLSGWTTLDTCESAAQCNASLGTCTDAPCVATDLQCSGHELQSCNPAAADWELRAECATAAQCDLTNARCAAAAACDAGQTRCQFGYWQRCKDSRDGYQDTEVCINSAHCLPAQGCSGPACTPGAYRCADATLQRCDPNRQWARVESCAGPEYCNATAKACSVAPCEPGTQQCSGADWQRCAAGNRASPNAHWETQARCAAPSLCGAEQGCSTPLCDVGDYQCDGASLQRCSISRNAWITVRTCESPALCNGPAKRCDAPRCPPAGFLCDPLGQLLRCDDGGAGYVLVEDCGSLLACDAELGRCLGSSAACTPGGFRCNGQFLERCHGSVPSWHPERRCDSAALCDAQAKSCRGPAACAPGQYQCVPRGGSGTSGVGASAQPVDLRVCSAGRDSFVLAEACGPDQLCDAEHGQCDDCRAFVEGCLGDSRTICSNDGQEVELEEACPAGTRCVAAATAGCEAL